MTDLLAILLRSGTNDMSVITLARHILSQYGNDLRQLAKANEQELMRIKGIGESKALTIIAAFELGKRKQLTECQQRNQVTSSRDTFNYLQPHFSDLTTEEFKVLLLNRNNRIIKLLTISKGGIAGTVVDSRVIFKHAIEHLCSSIILAHNHPSGNLKPSNEDKVITEKSVKAGNTMQIKVLDHLIFAGDSYYSFADEGLI